MTGEDKVDAKKIKEAITSLEKASRLLAGEKIDKNDEYGMDILCSLGEVINDTTNLLDRI